jgi:hypothetical protein
MRRSSRGERALIGGSIAVLLALFLPWLSTSCAGGCGGTDLGGSIDGVHGLGLVTLLGLLLVIGLWSVRSNPDRVRIPALPLTDPRIYMLCGALEVTGAPPAPFSPSPFTPRWAGSSPSPAPSRPSAAACSSRASAAARRAQRLASSSPT